MTLSDFIPPIGWFVALSASLTTALWVQSAPLKPADNAVEGAIASPVAEGGEHRFSLPPKSDAVRAAELFAARPLLAEGRRSFVPLPVAEPTPPEPAPPAEVPQDSLQIALDPPNVSMRGTVETAGTRRVLFRDELSGAETWYQVGEAVLGWTIVEILPDETRLQLQDAEITFNLYGE